ncbi:hypothetical protein [Glaesserella sp.]|uniref:hypothetical protein n=1 Tax=Glaesserella sp. TaxID=2094731 RepID=UPI00359F50CA
MKNIFRKKRYYFISLFMLLFGVVYYCLDDYVSLVRAGYCPKTRTILAKEELYRNAMRDYLQVMIEIKQELAEEFESNREFPYYNIWLGKPINGYELKNMIKPILGSSVLYSDKFYKKYKDKMKVFEDVDSILDNELFPKNNSFNIYDNVIMNFIYAYDCCTVYTREEAIERVAFLEKGMEMYKDALKTDSFKIKRTPTAFRYLNVNFMFTGFDDEVIENNAFDILSYFIPINTCGNITVNIRYNEDK